MEVNLKISDILRLQVLSQIENKFIIGKLDRYIVAIDQHAIHERINLEQLIWYYHNTPSG